MTGDKLFDALDDGQGGDDTFSLRINQKFAQKYEAKKKYEELSQLRDKYGDVPINDEDEETDSEDDEVEDEEGELVTPPIDAQILKTIAMIQAKDPKVYEPENKFFDEEKLEEAQKLWQDKLKSKGTERKSMTIRDYNRLRLKAIAEGKHFDGDEPENDEDVDMTDLTHVEEQQKIKDEFKSAIKNASAQDDDDGDLFVRREKTLEEVADEEEQYRAFLMDTLHSEGHDDLSQWKDHEKTISDPNESFLMEYVLSRGWVEKDKKKIPTYDEIVAEHHDESDEEAVEAADEFETKYNFRFEEEGANEVTTYSRKVEGSVRRTNDARKRQREAKAQREEEDKIRKAEELKRLKNLKKQEIWDRLKKIQEIAGLDDPSGNSSGDNFLVAGLDDVDLEADFDPEEHDRKMEALFSDAYYDGSKVDSKKPKFDDDIDISDIVPPADTSSRKKSRKGDKKRKRRDLEEDDGEAYAPIANDDDNSMQVDDMAGDGGYEDEATYQDTEVAVPEGATSTSISGKAKKPKVKFDEYLDEYYQLDYEDMIGDLPTRFKYRQVSPESYGLTSADILLADDKDLNSLYSLKKIAPFRKQEAVERDKLKYRKNRRKRIREFRDSVVAKLKEGGLEEAVELLKRPESSTNDSDLEETVVPAVVEQNGEKPKKKKKSKKVDAMSQDIVVQPETAVVKEVKTKQKKAKIHPTDAPQSISSPSPINSSNNGTTATTKQEPMTAEEVAAEEERKRKKAEKKQRQREKKAAEKLQKQTSQPNGGGSKVWPRSTATSNGGGAIGNGPARPSTIQPSRLASYEMGNQSKKTGLDLSGQRGPASSGRPRR
ncbi:hypothetical protein SmJEL517_g01900 [Synchytrium microbalum]|uniref:Kri1-like C-terminal domain-containing protein n=1 Tax=Synchytrium microbalum TaxID=1806994 RepID=A0A507C841_9FUNG|nr:uncharacterized protein SmJEL517_g01900 [Synchytrium microbalum]TPX35681.1 hypothetical protein SmJEL517_g01900 [Synchytrium microbalum]